MTLLTEFKDKTASLARLLTAAMTSMLLLGILAPSGSGGTNDGVLNFSNTPFVCPRPTIITFDAPGGGTGPGQGTITFAINPAGTISGRYADAGNAIHGIRAHAGRRNHHVRRSGRGDRAPARHSALQHQPGRRDARATTTTRAMCFTVSCAVRHGVITTFDIPGAGTGPGQGTFAGNINPRRRSRDATLTRAMWLTASCALRTAPSLRLMLRTPAQAPARAPLFLPAIASTPQGRSRRLP